MADLDIIEKSYAVAVRASNVDQWQLNSAIHFNTWEDLQKQDFDPVVAAFRTLVGKFYCDVCHDPIEVRPVRGKRESLFCTCGKYNISLVEKNETA